MFIYEKEDKISRKIFVEFWITYLEKSIKK